MKRLLVVSPHFPPVNAPDHQRVRSMLPHLRELGWEPSVLAVSPGSVLGANLDPILERTYPADLEVLRVDALPLVWTRPFGFGTLGLRALPAIAKKGASLLRQRKFDAVFFSTAQFTLMALGPRWQRTFRVPYVLDFHDPWLVDRAAARGTQRPGGWKYRFAQWQAALLEPLAVRKAAHCLCVSEAYPKMLRQRYPEMEATRFSVIPFAASEEDHKVALEFGEQGIFDPHDGRIHVVYTGIIEAPFLKPLRTFLAGLARAIAKLPAARKLAVHFVGTTYAPHPASEGIVATESRNLSLTDFVDEHRPRIPYFSALKCWHDARALLVFGSADAGYVPSKLEPSLATGRPLLALFDPAAPSSQRLADAGVWIAGLEGEAAEERVQEFLLGLCTGTPSHDVPRLPAFGAAQMTAKIARVFDQCTE